MYLSINQMPHWGISTITLLNGLTCYCYLIFQAPLYIFIKTKHCYCKCSSLHIAGCLVCGKYRNRECLETFMAIWHYGDSQEGDRWTHLVKTILDAVKFSWWGSVWPRLAISHPQWEHVTMYNPSEQFSHSIGDVHRNLKCKHLFSLLVRFTII